MASPVTRPVAREQGKHVCVWAAPSRGRLSAPGAVTAGDGLGVPVLPSRAHARHAIPAFAANRQPRLVRGLPLIESVAPTATCGPTPGPSPGNGPRWQPLRRARGRTSCEHLRSPLIGRALGCSAEKQETLNKWARCAQNVGVRTGTDICTSLDSSFICHLH